MAASPDGERRFESPSWERLAADVDAPGRAPPAPGRVGPYRIEREIGRGGMGRVFLAEQEQAEFRRRVALKIVDRPVVTDDAIRRFRNELRILASLEHSGIARFLDGGCTPDGTWFLALEYVEGVDLLEHALRLELSVEERVRLFLAMLEAVAYAHERSVVHRDLKPGNVLVGSDGRPRLLDFGIAKLLDPASERGASTRTEFRALTAAYASPEQFRGEPATCASDVYSLGVILYQLLAGVHPYGEDVDSRAEIESAALTGDPEPPSTAARRRSAAPPPPDGDAGAPPTRPPPGRIGADLDAICLKALRKEPPARYADAGALAEDLRRYLAGHPVEARRGGRRYRVEKLLRRNRMRLATAAAAALVIGALAFAAAVVVRSERPSVRRGPGPAPPPDASVEELERLFAAAPESLETGAALVLELHAKARSKEALAVVARMRQIPGAAEDPLTDYVEAWVASGLDEPHRTLTLTTRALAHPLTAERLDLRMKLRAVRARALSVLGRRDEARAELEQSVREAEQLGDQNALARNLNDLAIEEVERGGVDRAEQLFERALAASRRAGERLRGGVMLINLANLARLRGRPDLAEPRLREAVSIFDEVGRPQRGGQALAELSDALRELGRPEEVAVLQEEAIARLRRSSENTTLELAVALFYRGSFEIDQGRLAAIDPTAREIETAAHASGDRMSLAHAEVLRGRSAAAVGEPDAARGHLGEARRLWVQDGHLDLAAVAGLLAARVERDAGNGAEAARLAEESAGPFRASTENDLVFQAEALLARLAAESGRTEEAARRLAALGTGAEDRPGVSQRLAFLAARARLARARGLFAEARRDLETALAAARGAWRKLDELDLRLDIAEIDSAAGDHAAAIAASREVADEASRLGLAGLAARARRLADAP